MVWSLFYILDGYSFHHIIRGVGGSFFVCGDPYPLSIFVLDLKFGDILGFHASAFTNLKGELVLRDLKNAPEGNMIYGDLG